MYGLEVAQYRGVSQIYPPCCVLPYRVMDKIVHYSKMSKARKKPRKSFPERWEMMPGGSPVFRTDRGGGALTPPFRSTAFYRRRIQPSEFRALALRPFRGLSCGDKLFTRGFPHTERKNRSERRVGGHRGIYRTWPDAEHIFLHPHFRTFSARKHSDIHGGW